MLSDNQCIVPLFTMKVIVVPLLSGSPMEWSFVYLHCHQKVRAEIQAVANLIPWKPVDPSSSEDICLSTVSGAYIGHIDLGSKHSGGSQFRTEVSLRAGCYPDLSDMTDLSERTPEADSPGFSVIAMQGIGKIN